MSRNGSKQSVYADSTEDDVEKDIAAAYSS